MESQKVQVVMQSNKLRQVNAIVQGHIALHPCVECAEEPGKEMTFSLTHVPTGAKILGRLPPTVSKAAFDKLQALGDEFWEFGKVTKENVNIIKNALSDYVLPDGTLKK